VRCGILHSEFAAVSLLFLLLDERAGVRQPRPSLRLVAVLVQFALARTILPYRIHSSALRSCWLSLLPSIPRLGGFCKSFQNYQRKLLDKAVDLWYNPGNVTGIDTGNVATCEAE
jgi:hypothetical protein